MNFNFLLFRYNYFSSPLIVSTWIHSYASTLSNLSPLYTKIAHFLTSNHFASTLYISLHSHICICLAHAFVIYKFILNIDLHLYILSCLGHENPHTNQPISPIQLQTHTSQTQLEPLLCTFLQKSLHSCRAKYNFNPLLYL